VDANAALRVDSGAVAVWALIVQTGPPPATAEHFFQVLALALGQSRFVFLNAAALPG